MNPSARAEGGGPVERSAADPCLELVLVHPQIAWNTGNVGRTCVALGARLHLIAPLGFELTDKRVKRAGLDYWRHLDLQLWPSWSEFEHAVSSAAVEGSVSSRAASAGLDPTTQHAELPGNGSSTSTQGTAPTSAGSGWAQRAWFFSAEASEDLWHAPLATPATAPLYLVFGNETAGLPRELRERFASRMVRLPMLAESVRSLNLSTAAAVGAYEALRRLGVASRPL